MAFDVGSIVAKVTADISGFQKGMIDAENKAQSFGDKMQHAAKVAGVALAAVGAAAGGAMVVAAKMGIDAAKQFEQQEIAFTTLLKDREKAIAAIKAIEKDAKSTPYNLPDLIKANQLLVSAGVNTEDARKQILNLGNAISATGGGTDELNRMVVNLQQIKSLGVASAVDIKQFAFAGINIYKLLADSTGLTVSQIQDSTITYEMLTEALAKASAAGGMYEGANENQSKSLQGLKSNLEDVISITLKDVVMQTGLYDAIKRAVSAAVNFVDVAGTRFIDFVKRAGDGIGNLKTGFDEFATTVKGKTQPLVDLFQTIIDRFFQIAAAAGISFEFGGATAKLQKLITDIDFYTERALQILGEFYQKAKNFLAFGGTEGDASIVQALEGIWNRLKPFKEALEPLFATVMEKLRLTGQILETQVKPAFAALAEVLRPLIDALLPYLIKFLETVILQIIVLIVGFITFITGLIGAIANALPYIAQAIEGIVQFIRGMVQVITGLLTGDIGKMLEGFKQLWKGAYDFVSNILLSIVKFITGFIKTIVDLFQSLYDVLVGHSIIPDLVNGIYNWFAKLPNLIRSAVSGILDILTKPFEDAKKRIGDAVDWIKDKLDFTQRHSPSVVDIVERGVAKVNKAMAGIDFGISMAPSMAASAVTNNPLGTAVNNVVINLDGAMIGDVDSAGVIAERIGDSIVKRLQMNVRF